jgi:spore coat polysaccharide biosynthesis protein SpsF (cytidylyltransferase family)
MKTKLLIPTRLDSSRLPNKALIEIAGKQNLQWIVDRARHSRELGGIILAIASGDKNKPLVEFAEKNNLDIYIGNPDVVIDRAIEAAKHCKADIVVDISHDCTLVDPRIIDILVKQVKHKGFDYASNIVPRTWPDGFDLQCYRRELLEQVKPFITNKNHLMHTGWNIQNYCKNFYPELKMYNLKVPEGYQFPEWNLSLDTPNDLDLIMFILNHFVSKGNDCPSAIDIIEFLKENDSLLELNNSKVRKSPDEG